VTTVNLLENQDTVVAAWGSPEEHKQPRPKFVLDLEKFNKCNSSTANASCIARSSAATAQQHSNG
jgi:hypothetical protein